MFNGEETKGEEFSRLVASVPMAITVGDRVTDTLGGMGRTPDIQVVDGVERRMKRDPPKVPFARLIRVKNPAATLTAEAISGMKDAFTGRKPVRVLVEGEEDLMAMLAIAMAPVFAVVFYGQPGVGVVAVKADAVAKARNRAILAEMGVKGIH
jgi:GTP-dependent dephospho-CoA kinase